AVFMNATLRDLARRVEVHLISMLDRADQLEANRELASFCTSAEFVVRSSARPRLNGTILPRAVREFASEELEWLLHRQIYTRAIDVVQLEYTPMAQYAGHYRHIANALFEHDVYFQSIARGLKGAPNAKAAFEYLRALRYELKALPRMDRIQTCTAENRDYLLGFLPQIARKTQAGLRAAIDVSRYRFHSGGREPLTMLFLGSFRHLPNQLALEWFTAKVLPRVLDQCPQARLVVAGSEMQPNQAPPLSPAIEVLGCVADVRQPLSRYAAFVCPVLSGSGIRVKLLEAFATGIPAVSTPLGAEGLARKDGEFCLLASEPEDFARRILELFSQPEAAAEMAERARHEVATRWNTRHLTEHLVESYRDALVEKRGATSSRFPS
ncbi:MAG TPA: glycosyltransferase, partial [Bryobacteraceae bacterium]